MKFPPWRRRGSSRKTQLSLTVSRYEDLAECIRSAEIYLVWLSRLQQLENEIVASVPPKTANDIDVASRAAISTAATNVKFKHLLQFGGGLSLNTAMSVSGSYSTVNFAGDNENFRENVTGGEQGVGAIWEAVKTFARHQKDTVFSGGTSGGQFRPIDLLPPQEALPGGLIAISTLLALGIQSVWILRSRNPKAWLKLLERDATTSSSQEEHKHQGVRDDATSRTQSENWVSPSSDQVSHVNQTPTSSFQSSEPPPELRQLVHAQNELQRAGIRFITALKEFPECREFAKQFDVDTLAFPRERSILRLSADAALSADFKVQQSRHNELHI